jgi:uncharacterized NAD-dependent epimerase/dehydratase family protein
VESEKLTDQAKQHIRDKRRDRALLLLKLKKMKENEVDNIDKQLITVMEMIDNIEWESINIQALKALKDGNNALNKLHSEMSYEDVVNLLDETNEAIEVCCARIKRQIGFRLSQTLFRLKTRSINCLPAN